MLNFAVSFVTVLAIADSSPQGPKDEDHYKHLSYFTKVLNMVQTHYVEPVPTETLIRDAIRGMLAGRDPHTDWMPPESYEEFKRENQGEFGGIGVEISFQNGSLTVISPIEDTPAWKAGIEPGDKIVNLNSKPTKGMTMAEAAKEMRGQVGSKITMTVRREGVDEPIQFELKRAKVKVSSVKYTNLNDGFGYFRVTSFIEKTSSDLKRFIKRHRDQSGGEIKGAILDLRKNPGGLLDQAVAVSDLFLKEGLIVSTQGKEGTLKESTSATPLGTEPDYPIVVLIDSSSASASEIVAGALQDNKRALVVGERSFGKGSVQSVVKLGDGSALKLTVARYYTPNGRSIQAEGIVPDIPIPRISPEVLAKAPELQRPAMRESELEGHLLGESEKNPKLQRGPSSDKAQTHSLFEDYQVAQAYLHLKTLAFK